MKPMILNHWWNEGAYTEKTHVNDFSSMDSFYKYNSLADLARKS